MSRVHGASPASKTLDQPKSMSISIFRRYRSARIPAGRCSSCQKKNNNNIRSTFFFSIYFSLLLLLLFFSVSQSSGSACVRGSRSRANFEASTGTGQGGGRGGARGSVRLPRDRPGNTPRSSFNGETTIPLVYRLASASLLSLTAAPLLADRSILPCLKMSPEFSYRRRRQNPENCDGNTYVYMYMCKIFNHRHPEI